MTSRNYDMTTEDLTSVNTAGNFKVLCIYRICNVIYLLSLNCTWMREVLHSLALNKLSLYQNVIE